MKGQSESKLKWKCERGSDLAAAPSGPGGALGAVGRFCRGRGPNQRNRLVSEAVAGRGESSRGERGGEGVGLSLHSRVA